MPDLGRIFRVRKWDDNGRNYRLEFALGRAKHKRKRVVLMMCLGEYELGEPIDEAEIFRRLAMLNLKREGDASLQVETNDHAG